MPIGAICAFWASFLRVRYFAYFLGHAKKYRAFSSFVSRARLMLCSQRVTHGSSVYLTNSRDCCSMLEKLDFSRSPTMCGGTRKIRAISFRNNAKIK